MGTVDTIAPVTMDSAKVTSDPAATTVPDPGETHRSERAWVMMYFVYYVNMYVA